MSERAYRAFCGRWTASSLQTAKILGSPSPVGRRKALPRSLSKYDSTTAYGDEALLGELAHRHAVEAVFGDLPAAHFEDALLALLSLLGNQVHPGSHLPSAIEVTLASGGRRADRFPASGGRRIQRS
jgi:hypothetical protein